MPTDDPLRTPSPTAEQLLQAQNQALRSQDQALDQIHRNILQVQEVTHSIREEASLHSALLDDIQDDAEQGTRSAERGHETLRLVESRSDTKALQSTICVLMFTFIILVLFKLG